MSHFLILQEQQKYAQLQEIIKKLDEEKKRGDSLLYAMIPKAVADRLRKGITALETCQVRRQLLARIVVLEKPQNIRASASEICKTEALGVFSSAILGNMWL